MNITNIPAPRVPFVDERTGLISREWYRFLLNLFVLTGSGREVPTLEDILVTPNSGTAQESRFAEAQKQVEGTEVAPVQGEQFAELQKQLEALALNWVEQLQQAEELGKRLQALELQPCYEPAIPDPSVDMLPPVIAGYTGTVTTASLVGKTITIQDGLITAFT